MTELTHAVKTKVFVVTSDWAEYTTVVGVASDLNLAKRLAADANDAEALTWGEGYVNIESRMQYNASRLPGRDNLFQDSYSIEEHELAS